MPFFYSQYLTDSKKPPTPRPSPSSSTRSHAGATADKPPSRLIWHSNTGASHCRQHAPSRFKPLSSKSHHYYGKKKTVHFSTIEVQQFHFDWSLAGEVWFDRTELTKMGERRFDDAAALRKERGLDGSAREEPDDLVACDDDDGATSSSSPPPPPSQPQLQLQPPQPPHSRDDASLASKPSSPAAIAALLAAALSDPDAHPSASLRGIEHFVYPDLQKEMIRRKKLVQSEVLEFVRSKRPDPQGWRLAQHSRNYSLWAREVAAEKGK
eukprot:CAMPEP_0171332944 /NCGR_PEP_ID=MMETSP0878-20121228/3701_1 /TAXON_ID=67004 /ORGANISM="Thalassiosira weissflogii, Strain CCMP1336" /LENGTH=266 /DNA_ID=CAMNT_0011833797 /DNA_START=219 /DNA_END=1016 /DNA_ORIENTATION=+